MSEHQYHPKHISFYSSPSSFVTFHGASTLRRGHFPYPAYLGMRPTVAIYKWCGNYFFPACNFTIKYLRAAHSAILRIYDGASQEPLQEVQD